MGTRKTYLASLGFKCRATEISHERGQKHVSESPNLSWDISDGVHLNRFEETNSFDIVISDQVVEHLHPDDLHDILEEYHQSFQTEANISFVPPIIILVHQIFQGCSNAKYL